MWLCVSKPLFTERVVFQAWISTKHDSEVMLFEFSGIRLLGEMEACGQYSILKTKGMIFNAFLFSGFHTVSCVNKHLHIVS